MWSSKATEQVNRREKWLETEGQGAGISVHLWITFSLPPGNSKLHEGKRRVCLVHHYIPKAWHHAWTRTGAQQTFVEKVKSPGCLLEVILSIDPKASLRDFSQAH